MLFSTGRMWFSVPRTPLPALRTKTWFSHNTFWQTAKENYLCRHSEHVSKSQFLQPQNWRFGSTRLLRIGLLLQVSQSQFMLHAPQWSHETLIVGILILSQHFGQKYSGSACGMTNCAELSIWKLLLLCVALSETTPIISVVSSVTVDWRRGSHGKWRWGREYSVHRSVSVFSCESSEPSSVSLQHLTIVCFSNVTSFTEVVISPAALNFCFLCEKKVTCVSRSM